MNKVKVVFIGSYEDGFLSRFRLQAIEEIPVEFEFVVYSSVEDLNGAKYIFLNQSLYYPKNYQYQTLLDEFHIQNSQIQSYEPIEIMNMAYLYKEATQIREMIYEYAKDAIIINLTKLMAIGLECLSEVFPIGKVVNLNHDSIMMDHFLKLESTSKETTEYHLFGNSKLNILEGGMSDHRPVLDLVRESYLKKKDFWKEQYPEISTMYEQYGFLITSEPKIYHHEYEQLLSTKMTQFIKAYEGDHPIFLHLGLKNEGQASFIPLGKEVYTDCYIRKDLIQPIVVSKVSLPFKIIFQQLSSLTDFIKKAVLEEKESYLIEALLLTKACLHLNYEEVSKFYQKLKELK